jgi:hypothetical protein
MIDPIVTPSPPACLPLPDAKVVSGPGTAGGPRFAAPWQVDIGPSRRLAIVLVVAHLSAALSVALAAPPAPATVALLALIACSGWYHVRQVALVLRSGAVVGLRADADGSMLVRHRDGRVSPGRLLASTVVDRRVSLVRLRIVGERFSRTVPLLGDNCDRADFRRLRVGLEWQAGPALLSRQHSD